MKAYYRKGTIFAVLAFILLSGCSIKPSSPSPISTATLQPGAQGLSQDEISTLNSLEKLDDFPLYSMHYQGAFPQPTLSAESIPLVDTQDLAVQNSAQAGWGCTLFAALGAPESQLYGRNFDWRDSPAVLLFTDPPDGYASVSMVDIEYLGFSRDQAKTILDLPLNERKPLLSASLLPFDGMNEMGLAIGMAAVPPGEMQIDPNKKTIDELGVIREILDHASAVDEAVKILGMYNIDMSNVPLHYLVASTNGDSALVEFYQGKMFVFRNETPWQAATNFLVASTDGHPQGLCTRYDRVSQQLQEMGGKISPQEAFSLLSDVSQDSTQWSVVYAIGKGDIHIVMGQKYSGSIHTLHTGWVSK